MLINFYVCSHITKISNYFFYVGKSTNCISVFADINCLRFKAGHCIFQISIANAI